MTQHDADNAKVCVSKGCGAQSHIPHHGQENGRQERNEQTVSKSPYHRPATSAGNVAVNPRRGPAEKVGNQARDDDAQAEQRAEEHTDQSCDKACEEADDDGIRSEGKHRRTVQRRLRVFNQFVRNPFKRRDDLGNHHPKKITTVPIDVHLMVNHPEDIIPMCLEAGADIISFHPETANNKIFRLLNQIKDAGKKCGVVLNPATPAESIAEYAHLLDKVTVMSVDPGYAGQKFIPESLNKIRKLINMRKNNGYHYLTEIDGSCNEKTFGQIAESGVDVFIVGTSGLFSLHEDVSQAWDRMIEIFQRETVAA